MRSSTAGKETDDDDVEWKGKGLLREAGIAVPAGGWWRRIGGRSFEGKVAVKARVRPAGAESPAVFLRDFGEAARHGVDRVMASQLGPKGQRPC